MNLHFGIRWLQVSPSNGLVVDRVISLAYLGGLQHQEIVKEISLKQDSK